MGNGTGQEGRVALAAGLHRTLYPCSSSELLMFILLTFLLSVSAPTTSSAKGRGPVECLPKGGIHARCNQETEEVACNSDGDPNDRWDCVCFCRKKPQLQRTSISPDEDDADNLEI